MITEEIRDQIDRELMKKAFDRGGPMSLMPRYPDEFYEDYLENKMTGHVAFVGVGSNISAIWIKHNLLHSSIGSGHCPLKAER